MKSIAVLLIACLTLCHPGLGQWSPWTEQTTGLPIGFEVGALHAVDANVVWGIGWNINGLSRYFIRTTDGGATWVSDTIPSAPISFVPTGIYAFDERRAWMVMYNTVPRQVPSGGLYGTTNGGATWKKDTVAFTAFEGGPYFVHFFDSDNGVAVGVGDPGDGYFAIFVTSNGGANWSRVPRSNIPPPESAEFAIPSEFAATKQCLWFPTTKFGGGRGRYLRTTDKGLTWSVHVLPSTSATRLWPVLAFQDDSIGLGQSSQAGILKTTDGGVTWNLIPNTSWLSFRHLESVPNTPGMFVATSAFNGQNPPSQYIWGTVFTTDGGVTWTRMDRVAGEYTNLAFASPTAGWRTCFRDPCIHKFTISPGRLIGTSQASVSFSLTGTGMAADTMAIDIANYGTDPLKLTSILPPGPHFTIVHQPTLPLTLATLQSVGLTLTFTPLTGGILHDSLVVISNASNTLRSPVFLSGEGFAPQVATAGLLYAASGSLFSIDAKSGTTIRIDTLGTVPMHSLAVDPSKHRLYGMSAKPYASMMYRIDCAYGTTMPVRTFPVGDIRAIAFGPGDSLYGATMWGDFYRLNIASGAATYIGSSSDVTVMSLTFSPSGKLWASGYVGTTYDNIFTVNTSTGEVTLVGRTGGNLHIPSIAFTPSGKLYGLTGAGADTNTIIFIDTLTGAGSKLFSTGTTGLLAIAMSPQDPSSSVENQPATGVPRAFALEQNFPNPCNPSTTITFELPKSSEVRLSVYDLLGREVSVLVNERRNAGVHEVRFDASGLSSGVYFDRLQAGDFVQTRKLLVLR